MNRRSLPVSSVCATTRPLGGTVSNGFVYQRLIKERWIEPMTTLAFVAGILLGGKAGVFFALYVRGMAPAAVE